MTTEPITAANGLLKAEFDTLQIAAAFFALAALTGIFFCFPKQIAGEGERGASTDRNGNADRLSGHPVDKYRAYPVCIAVRDASIQRMVGGDCRGDRKPGGEDTTAVDNRDGTRDTGSGIYHPMDGCVESRRGPQTRSAKPVARCTYRDRLSLVRGACNLRRGRADLSVHSQRGGR